MAAFGGEGSARWLDLFRGFAAQLGAAARIGVDGRGSVPGSDGVRCGLFWSAVRDRLLRGAG